jgi:hypothetical protein
MVRCTQGEMEGIEKEIGAAAGCSQTDLLCSAGLSWAASRGGLVSRWLPICMCLSVISTHLLQWLHPSRLSDMQGAQEGVGCWEDPAS